MFRESPTSPDHGPGIKSRSIRRDANTREHVNACRIFFEFISNGVRPVNANGSGQRPHDAREGLPAAAAVPGHPTGYRVRAPLRHPCTSSPLRARAARVNASVARRLEVLRPSCLPSGAGPSFATRQQKTAATGDGGAREPSLPYLPGKHGESMQSQNHPRASWEARRRGLV